MNFSPREILKKYWGYDNFRPMQEDIIHSSLEGKDTLALLPTGGGKSICFQVPALVKDGICIVISPLIALMKDQVQNLNKRNINAVAIYSGMSYSEIDATLDNCIYGKIKFLYCSPERLTTPIFKERLQKMNVNLLAIDESHCISQWGYDFRPPYLQIAELRQLIPKTPVLALTATATPEVVKDIQEKLAFKKEHVFQKSFERKNVAYKVKYEEDKFRKMLKICKNTAGTGIVYVRNRKQTQEVSTFLNHNNISSDYYHAGLSSKERDIKQENWINNKTRIIVATNAFGMGIDKPDVRLVIHIDLADSLEAYFQEAGRAGRDEKESFALLLFSKSDALKFKQKTEQQFPSIDTVKSVYNNLGSFYQLAIGAGKEQVFNFDLAEFSKRYSIKPRTVLAALKFIEKDNYIQLTESVYTPSKVKFLIQQSDLQILLQTNPKMEEFVKLILRSYTGVFDNYTTIRENILVQRSNYSSTQIVNGLKKLKSMGVLDYQSQNSMPKITFTEERIAPNNFRISKKNYELRKQVIFKKMGAMIEYASSKNTCRSQLLLSYFGENNAPKCEICDYCNKENDKDLPKNILALLTNKPLNAKEIANLLGLINENKIVETLQYLVDNESIFLNEENKFCLDND